MVTAPTPLVGGGLSLLPQALALVCEDQAAGQLVPPWLVESRYQKVLPA